MSAVSRITLFLLASLFAFAAVVSAEEALVQMNLITDQGIGKSIGTVTLKDTPGGLVLTPALSGLAPGTHGFHVHEKPDCGPGTKDGKAVDVEVHFTFRFTLA